MEYPNFYEKSRSTYIQSIFGGYNRSAEATEDEFYSMTNMGSGRYPSLFPRLPRGSRLFEYDLDVKGACSAWSPTREYVLLIIESNAGQGILRVVDPLTGKVTANRGLGTDNVGERVFVRMGAVTVLFPDKLIIRVLDGGTVEIETLENETAVSASVPENFGGIGYYMCDRSSVSDGTDDKLVADDEEWKSDEVPVSPENGQVWLDRSTKTNDPYGSWVGDVKIYSELYNSWSDLYPTYVKLRYPGIGKGFAVGDTVTITVPEKGGPIRSIEGNKKIEACGDDYIVVQGILDYSELNVGTVNPFHVGITVKRTVPELDFVTEAGNRLWGCRNALVDGEWINEIYVSALGDAKNWNKFEGIASDSYAVTIGAQGPFTGAATYSDVPHFFKERYAIKIYGTAPSNFETVTVAVAGVEAGSYKSLANVNGTLFYKSRRGIMAYDGSYPTLISREFGTDRYTDAVGGELDGRYYVCLTDKGGKRHLFVYDTEARLWHREDNSDVILFCRTDEALYAVEGDGGIWPVGQAEAAEDFEWSCETGVIGLSDPDNKYVSRIRIRADIPARAYLEISLEYDSSGVFAVEQRFNGGGLGTGIVDVIPARCDHFRLRLSGKGYVRIYSVTYNYETGSDITI